MTNITFTDKHLRVILTALRTYYRLRSSQVGIAMDEAYPDKNLSWDDCETIEKTVRAIAFKEIQHPHSYYGFNNPELKDGTLAYEIEKTLEEYLSVKRNDGYWGSGCNFNGALKTTDEPLPEIQNFYKFKDYSLTKLQTKKVLKLKAAQKYKEMWEYIDGLGLNLPKCEKTEIVGWAGGVCVRCHKPRNCGY